MVIWLIGKSGSGKTFFAKKILSKIRRKKIHIDGDEIREKFFNNKLGFDLKSRRRNAEFIVNLCKYLEFKGHLVVCSILSVFPEIQKKNRKSFDNYFQIYLKTSTKILKINNSKKVYSNKKNIVGIDINFPKPYKSDLVIHNKFDKKYKIQLKKIFSKLKYF